MNKGIIYKAYNKISNKSYIGQTKQPLKQRVSQHYSNSKNNKTNNKFLRALNKYKKEDWIWSTLIETYDYQLDYYEKHFIKELNTYKFGYNSCPGGRIEGENHHMYSDTIYHLYNPECGEIFATRCELMKMHEHFTNILCLVSGEWNHIQGYILAENKDNYEKLTNQIKYKFYNSDFGVIEGTTKDLSNQFNFKENGFQRIVNKKYRSWKGWVLYENKDIYFELVPKNKKYTFSHKEFGIITCKKEYLIKEFNLKYQSLVDLINTNRKSLHGWTIIKD